MTVMSIVKAAIPNATPETADYILWARTPYPAGAVTAKFLYQAARRFHRATQRGKSLCTWCDREVPKLGDDCERCAAVMKQNCDGDCL